MRLDKFLADAGLGSRSILKQEIRKKNVTINDITVTDPGFSVNEKDVVCFKGKRILAAAPRYFMLNKPAGCVCATKDRDKTVLDYLRGEDTRTLFPVGRLDKDTEGLLLITDDGAFAHNMTSPRKHVNKTYYFEGEGHLVEDAPKRAEEGIDIGDEKLTKPAVLEIISRSTGKNGEMSVTGKLTISEGRYHQVKRMMARLGVTITYLKRISIGGLLLDEALPKGQYRLLTEEELAMLSSGEEK